MTISIEPTDFGEDIMASISPLLGAFGLLDANGSVDINNWTLEKALGVFGTYERTEFILNLLSGYISTPRMVYREISSGLIVKKGDLPPSQVQEDEWFSISGGNGWRVSLVVNHQRAGALPNGEHAHHIDLGLGVEVDDLPFTLNSGTLLLNGHLHVPLLRIKNKETSSGTYVVTNDLPEIETERLIWDPTGAYLSRIALSANLSPETGRFGTQAPSAEAIALNCAFGQPHAQDSTSIVAKIALLDFIAQQNGIPSTLEIDIVDAVNGGMAGVLENLVPAMMEMLPDDAQSFAENLLPMLGLLDSDWSTGGVPTVSWPRINIINLIDELQNDSGQAWNRVRAWLLELTHPEVATQWLTHLYALIFPTAPPPGLVGGSCTQADPAFVKFLDLPGMSGELLIALWEDVAGDKMLDVGLKFNADKSLGNAIDVNGGLTAWIATVPITGGGSIDFFTEFIGDFLLEGIGGTDLMDETVGGGETGSPLDNLHVRLGQARLGVAIQRNGDVEPLIEMLDVDIGSSPVNHYPVIDLTSGSSVMDAIGGVLDTLLDTVSDALAENDVLQWLGSLVGLVAPRDGNFRTDWEGAGSAGDLRIDILRLIQDPKDEITDYYARLLETDIDPYGQGSMKAWVYVQEALVLLINTALSGPMKMDKPVMPSGQPAVLGDGTATSPWRLMIGQEGDIPGINFFTYVEPTDVTGVNRLTFGLGCLVSLLHIRRHLHLETNVDAGLISFKLAEVAVDDVPADTKLLPKIEITTKLHDAIVLQGETAEQIPVFTIPGLFFTVDGFSLALGWENGLGFGIRTAIHSPRIGSVAPDFVHLATQLPEIRSLKQFRWAGQKLYGPQGITRPNLDSFSVNGEDDFDDPSPSLIEYEDENGNNVSYTIQWDFHGLGCPELGFDTREGVFGLIDQTGTSNSLIDIPPNSRVIENEGVQMILGQILAIKGGSVGFMASTILRINPHLLFFDLSAFVHEIRSANPEEYNWHPDWSAYHPASSNHFGLGPLSLPYDWPSLNWSAFCSTPIEEVKRWFVEVVSHLSASGEPFIFPLMRWVTALMHNDVPNLSEPYMGWKVLVEEGTRIIIQGPDIPIEVVGDGTYARPWAVRISQPDSQTIEFTFWVEPDGPLALPQGPHVYSSIGANRLRLLEEHVDQLDTLQLNYESPDDWHLVCAEMLLRLSEFSERTQSAIGEISKYKLADLLMRFDQSLKSSDGFSTIESQKATTSRSIKTVHNGDIASNRNSPSADNVISECLTAISDWLPSDWDPATGQSTTGKHILLLLSNHGSVSQDGVWSTLLQSIKDDKQLQQPIPVTVHNWDSIVPLGPSANAILPSELAQQLSGIISVNFSVNHNDGETSEEIMRNQIKKLCSVVSASCEKFAIIAHHRTGNQIMSLINSGDLTEQKVVGVLTTNTPHEGEILSSIEGQNLKQIIQGLAYLLNSNSPISQTRGSIQKGVLDANQLREILNEILEVEI